MNTDIVTIIYLAQIVLLVVCAYMAWHARIALNGLGRGLILLFVLLIAQRLDFAFDIYDDNASVIVSSAVVVAVTYDIAKIYKSRDMYIFYLKNRKERIKELESLKDW